MRFSSSIDIDAPPQVVWAVWSDIERWPEWTASMSRVEPLGIAPLLAVGLRARVEQPKLRPAEWSVTEVDDGRRFVLVSKSPGLRVTATHDVEPRGAGSCAVSTVEFGGLIGPLVGWLTRSLTQRYMAMEGEGLKARSEAQAA
jgi:uncharacterized protein YndB with AHSA1/START domain